MMMSRPKEKLGYTPSYTRTDLTDALHEAFEHKEKVITYSYIFTSLKMRKNA
jgi:hypothetical protein